MPVRAGVYRQDRPSPGGPGPTSVATISQTLKTIGKE
jgi:hypothetical protein